MTFNIMGLVPDIANKAKCILTGHNEQWNREDNYNSCTLKYTDLYIVFVVVNLSPTVCIA